MRRVLQQSQTYYTDPSLSELKLTDLMENMEQVVVIFFSQVSLALSLTHTHTHLFLRLVEVFADAVHCLANGLLDLS